MISSFFLKFYFVWSNSAVPFLNWLQIHSATARGHMILRSVLQPLSEAVAPRPASPEEQRNHFATHLGLIWPPWVLWRLTTDSGVSSFPVSCQGTCSPVFLCMAWQGPWMLQIWPHQWEDREDSVRSLLLSIVYHSSFGTVFYQNLSVSKNIY